MRIRHPISFVLLIIVLIATGSLSVVWSRGHMVALLATFGLIGLLRYIAHHEGRHDFGKPAFWRKWV